MRVRVRPTGDWSSGVLLGSRLERRRRRRKRRRLVPGAGTEEGASRYPLRLDGWIGEQGGNRERGKWTFSLISYLVDTV